MPTSIVYTNQDPSDDGVALAADNLNTAVVAQAYLIKGGVMASTASGSSSSHVPGLDLPMPETAAVVMVPNLLDPTLPPQPIYVLVPVQTVPCQFNSDTYIDLFATEDGPVSTGSYIVPPAVPIGNPPPAQDPGTLRLCKVRMGATGITSVTQLATPCPVNQPTVEADFVEAFTWDTLGVSSTLVNNLDRIRYQLGAIYARVPGGGEWITAGTLEPWDTSQPGVLQPMVPWSTRGIVNGVAELDGTGRLPVGELPFEAIFSEPSFFSNGSFVDPFGSLTLALKVSGGLGVDTLYAHNIGSAVVPVNTIYAQDIGTAGLPVTDMWVTTFHTPAGGSISGDHITAGTDVNTPVLYVDTIVPHTPGPADCSRVITIANATLVVPCQINAGSFFTAGAATLGSLGVSTTATVGSSLGVGGQATFGSTGNSPGILVYGPVTVDDGPGPASVKVGGNRYTDAHADLMVAGDAIVQGNAYVRTTFHVGSSTTLQDVQCSSLSITGVFSGPILLDGDLTLNPAGALGSGSLFLRRLVYDRGPVPTVQTIGNGTANTTSFISNHDNFGAVRYHAGAGDGAHAPLFGVTWGGAAGTHGALPGVFLALVASVQPTGAALTAFTDPGGSAYALEIDGPDPVTGQGGFVVAFTFAPTAGQTYLVLYHVVEAPV